MSAESLEPVFLPAVYHENARAVLGDGNWDYSHFLREGLRLGINPNPYFDAEFVGAGPGGEPALLRWLRGDGPDSPHPLVDLDLVGEQMGAAPRPVLLARLTAGEGRLMRLHPLFWGAEYVAAHPRGAQLRHPLHHYLNRGWRHGHEPNPFFLGELASLENPTHDSAPALRWIRSDAETAVPTSLFDPTMYAERTGLAMSPKAAYLHFLRTGVWNDVRPSAWFDLEVIRGQVGTTGRPAVLDYLRVEHELRVRPSDRFDPADHADLIHRRQNYAGRVLERSLSPIHNPQFRQREFSPSPSILEQLHRLAPIAPDVVDELSAQLAREKVRVNSNDFASGRLRVLRALRDLDQPEEETIILTTQEWEQPQGATPIRVDRLASLPGVSIGDVAAAIVESARGRGWLLVSDCPLGDRVLAEHSGPLTTWGAIASRWPRHGNS